MLIFINKNEMREQPWQSHSTHTCFPFDILYGTGHSQTSAQGCGQLEHFPVKLLAGYPS